MSVAALWFSMGILALWQVITFAGVVWGLVELRAMQKSTHQVQYVPAPNPFQEYQDSEQQFEPVTDKVREQMKQDIATRLGNIQ